MMSSQYDPNQSPKFTEATKLLQQQKFVEAIAILQGLTKDKPTVAEYWYALGVAYASNREPMAALDPLERACKMTPSPPGSCYQYGRILQLFDRHADAIAAFEASPKGTETSNLYIAKAQSHELLGNIEKADLAYRAALVESALRPLSSASIQVRYSRFLAKNNKFEAALWQLNQSLRKQPFDGMAWRLKGYVLTNLDRKEEAVDALEQAIAHGQRNRENLLAISQLYSELGNQEKAEAYRKEADPPPPPL